MFHKSDLGGTGSNYNEEENGVVSMPYRNLVEEPGIGELFNNKRESFQNLRENACWCKVNKLLNTAAKARTTS